MANVKRLFVIGDKVLYCGSVERLKGLYGWINSISDETICVRIYNNPKFSRIWCNEKDLILVDYGKKEKKA